jgi:hypothetical protein
MGAIIVKNSEQKFFKKFKKSNCDKTENLNCDEYKTKMVTKLKKSKRNHVLLDSKAQRNS